MRLDRLITLGLVNPLGRALGRFSAFDATPVGEQSRTLPVLMYHSISDDTEPAFSPYYKVCTSPARFAEQMRWLAEAGWQGVTLSEGLAWLKGNNSEQLAVSSQQSAVSGRQLVVGDEAPLSTLNSQPSTRSPRKPIAITFDDGFRDFHTAAFPALQKHGFTATMYVATGFIGADRKKFKDRECLTWGEIAELQRTGMEFGSHTVNHPVLVKLGWPEIEAELRESKTDLEQKLQCTIPAFAHPFAYPQENHEYTVRFSRTLQKLGYQSCVTTVIGRVRSSDDPFSLKRLPANSCDDRPLLSAKTRGAYDWLGVPQAFARRAKRRRIHAAT